MSLLSKLGNLRERLFCRMNGVVVDITSGVIGVCVGDEDNDRELVVTLQKGAGGKFKVVKQPPGFGKEIPTYAIRTPVEKLVAGDIIATDEDAFAFYVGKAKNGDDVDNATIRVLDPLSGKTSDMVVAVEPMLGGAGVLAVQTSMLQGGNLMLLALLGDDEDEGEGQNAYAKAAAGCDDEDDLLPLLLLSQQGGAGLGNLFGGEGGNSLLPLLLLGKGGGKLKGLLPLLLLQGQNGGKGLFGGDNPLLPLLLLGK